MPTTHECPGGCGSRVPRHRFACPPCWFRLPVPHRRAIERHHRRHTQSHSLAMHAAVNWFKEHPLSEKE